MVDRRGFAPRTAGCKPADLLTNLAAQKWHGGWVSRPHESVLETGALLVCHRRMKNWCSQSELHRHPLIGIQRSYLLDDDCKKGVE